MAVGGLGMVKGCWLGHRRVSSNKECMLFSWGRSRFVADFGPKRLGARANRCKLALRGL